MQVTFRPRLGEHEVREEAVRLLCRSEELRLQDMERQRGAEAEGGKRTEQEGPVSGRFPYGNAIQLHRFML